MTSQQDTELEEILYDYWAKHRDCKDGCQHMNQGEDTIQALTSWKDKEVQKAKLRLINTEIRKLQKNEVWYRFDDCVWELKQTRKRITKSLQSLESKKG